MPPVILAAAYAVGVISLPAAIFGTVAWAYGQHQERKARARARDALNANLQDRLINEATTDKPRSVIYGWARNADGIIFKATRGDKSQFYTRVIALAAHEVDGIEDVYFNDQVVELDGDGWVQTQPYAIYRRESATMTATRLGTTDSGYATFPHSHVVGASVTVTEGEAPLPFSLTESSPGVYTGAVFFGSPNAGAEVVVQYQYDVVVPKARVRKYLGAPGQNLAAVLGPMFPTMLGFDHRFNGIPCLIVDLEYDQDAFAGGLPTVTALVRGKRIFDPRLGTYVFSENPALIANDWMQLPVGGNAEADEIDQAAVIAAANACDVVHTFVRPSGSTARLMYTCNIVCDPAVDPFDTLDEILESMAGKRAWAGGKIRIKAGAYAAPVATLDETWCGGQGPIEIVSGQARQSLVNILKPVIADAAQAYVSAPAAPVRADAYIALDGEELPQDIVLGGVTDIDHAQHICGVMLRDARQALTVKIPCNLRAYPLEVFDVINVTLPRFGWSNKAFEVMSWEFSQTGGVNLTLKETDGSIYDPDAGFTDVDVAPNTQLPSPWVVPVITGLTVQSGTEQLMRQADGTVTSRALVSWDAIQDQAVTNSGAVEVRWWLASGPETAGQSIEVPGGDTHAFIGGLIDRRQYLFKVRARNSLARGNWSNQVLHEVIGKTEPPPDVSSFAVTEMPGQGRVYVWDVESVPADLEGFLIRYTSGSTIHPWPSMAPLFEAGRLERGRPANVPPDGTWTFAIKAVDSTGNESINARYVTQVFDQAAFGYPLLFVSCDALRWPGGRVNCAESGPWLVDIGSMTWDTIPDEWDLWLDFDGPSLGSMSYTHTVTDMGSATTFRVRELHVSGGVTTVEYRTSSDGVSFSSWAALTSSAITTRYIQLRWSLSGAFPVLYRAAYTLYA